MMKTVTFWYSRHGQTLFNVLGRMQEWCDSPLTEKGIQQAEEASQMLMDIPLTSVWTSTSERCIDTAKIIMQDRDISVHYEKGLKEMYFGTYEGARVKNHLDEIEPRRNVTFDWSDYGGENLDMLNRRIFSTYSRIYESSHDGDQILIVSHGSIFMHMMPVLFHIPVERYVSLSDRQYLPAPNGYVGSFTCTDGTYELKSLHYRDAAFIERLLHE